MAEKVDALLEDMVQELNHYRNENYFTEDEIRDIVKERRQSELVICVSPHTATQDYLKAIVYEK